MSSVNYDLNRKGVRLIASEDAWIKGKDGKYRLNPNYTFVGKVETSMPNMVISATKDRKPVYKGDVNSLNRTAKAQLVNHFFDDDGKRNSRSVGYLVVPKKGGKTK